MCDAEILRQRFGRNEPWAALMSTRQHLLAGMREPKRWRMIKCSQCPDAKRRRV